MRLPMLQASIPMSAPAASADEFVTQFQVRFASRDLQKIIRAYQHTAS
jgi:hypothetical protein